MSGADTPAPTRKLLGPRDPEPVTVYRPDGTSPFFLTCEHSGQCIPERLGTLGLPAHELERHIGWDIGAEAVARGLSGRLDATLVTQAYSRLVVDCNRWPHADDFIVKLSESTEVPGNQNVSEEEALARRDEIFAPYHDTIRTLLDARAVAGRLSVLISVHSCTPVFHGVSRPWHVGVLYEHDDRLARHLLELFELDGEPGELIVGDNEPYFMTEEKDYAVPVHGHGRGLVHVELEIRQDLIEEEAGQREWSERLDRVFREALGRLSEEGALP